MHPRDLLGGFELRYALKDALPDYARCHLDLAMKGDEGAAGSLCAASPNKLRGYIAVAAYLLRVPNPGYREIIRCVWNHDAEQLAYVAKDYSVSIRWTMAAGKFQHPFSGSLDVYRGVSGMTANQAARGLSWTTSRDVACWFAYRFATDTKRPLVLKSTIDVSDIVFYDNTREEEEIVSRRRMDAIVDPELGTWLEARERELAARAARKAKLLAIYAGAHLSQ